MRLSPKLASHNRLLRTLATMIAICSLGPWVYASDDGGGQSTGNSNYRDKGHSQASSASASSSSSSQSSGGKTISRSKASGSATGNAIAIGAANSSATSLQTNSKGDSTLSRSSSSSRIKVKGESKHSMRYPKSRDGEINSETSTISRGGVSVTRSVQSDENGGVMKLDATNKTQEISVREDIDGSIEVSVRNRKKNDDGNNNERVYEAESREELKKQAPEIVRMIERYEKMAGSTKATVVRDSKIKAKKLLDTRPLLSDGGRNDAQQMMRDQLQEMLDNNADNPQIQKMIRKMIEGLNQ